MLAIEVFAVFMTRIQWSYLMDRERGKNDHFHLFLILTKKEKNIYYFLVFEYIHWFVLPKVKLLYFIHFLFE